jgi:hypothetical protein
MKTWQDLIKEKAERKIIYEQDKIRQVINDNEKFFRCIPFKSGEYDGNLYHYMVLCHYNLKEYKDKFLPEYEQDYTMKMFNKIEELAKDEKENLP